MIARTLPRAGGRTLMGASALALTLAGCTTGAAGPQAAQSDMARMQAEFDKVPDTPGDGPYAALMEVDPAIPGHLVYRPADLSRVPAGKLGVLIWGNGACADDGASARLQLAQIASHGYLVVAAGKWRSGPNAKEPKAAPRAPSADGIMPAPPTSADDLRKALDWAVAENSRAGGRYAGRIDQDAIAVAGFSCGGVQALEIAGDPRIDTVIVQNSGIFKDASMSIAGMTLPKSALSTLHTPVLYLLGGPTDIAYENGMDDFARIDHVPAAMINLPVGHGGTYNEPLGGKAARIVIDWLNWQLRDDAAAKQQFIGTDCGLCDDADVTLERKNLR